MNGPDGLTRTARLAALLLVGLAGAARGTLVEPRTARQLVRDADLVFVGTVTGIDYRFSSSSAGSQALPHSFVTFSVQSTLKGKLAGGAKTLTLRLLGGPTRKGRYLRALDCPLFDVGDRDVVFVRRNNRNVCPIAGWAQGRFRLVGSEVFNDEGREVWLVGGKTLAFGDEHPTPLLDHQRGPNHFVSRLRGGAESEEPDPPAPPIAGVRLDAAQFLGFVRQLAASTAGAADVAPFADADPDRAFEVRLFEEEDNR